MCGGAGASLDEEMAVFFQEVLVHCAAAVIEEGLFVGPGKEMGYIRVERKRPRYPLLPPRWSK